MTTSAPPLHGKVQIAPSILIYNPVTMQLKILDVVAPQPIQMMKLSRMGSLAPHEHYVGTRCYGMEAFYC